MIEKLTLTQDLYITKGTARNVYSFPKDNQKILKVSTIKKVWKNQNFIESFYYNFLQRNNIGKTSNYISKYFGEVDTNFGKALVFEKICDFDGSLSQSLSYFLRSKDFSKLSLEKLNLLIDEFKVNIVKNDILFLDIALGNILLQEYEKEKFRLVIIDGLGGNNIPRFLLTIYFEAYRKYKIKKAIKKFEKRVVRDSNNLA